VEIAEMGSTAVYEVGAEWATGEILASQDIISNEVQYEAQMFNASASSAAKNFGATILSSSNDELSGSQQIYVPVVIVGPGQQLCFALRGLGVANKSAVGLNIQSNCETVASGAPSEVGNPPQAVYIFTPSSFQNNLTLTLFVSTPKTNIVGSTPTTITVPDQSVIYNDSAQNVTLTAQVTATSSPVNEGIVTFTIEDNHGNTVGVPVWGFVTDNDAMAEYILPAGTTSFEYRIEVVYSGGSDFQGSSEMASLTVNKVATTILVSPVSYQANIPATQNVTMSAQVTTANGSVVNQGSVTFQIESELAAGQTPQLLTEATGSVNQGKVSIVCTLPANFSGTYLWAGTDTMSDGIITSYSGGDNFQASNNAIRLNP